MFGSCFRTLAVILFQVSSLFFVCFYFLFLTETAQGACKNNAEPDTSPPVDKAAVAVVVEVMSTELQGPPFPRRGVDLTVT